MNRVTGYTSAAVHNWWKPVLVLSLALNVVGMGLAVYKLVSRQPPQPNTYPSARDSLFAELTPAPGAVVMLGASLNDWAEWNELLGDHRVINRGVSGATSAEVRARLPAILQAGVAQIFLLVGLNDLGRGGTINDVIANHREMATMVREHGSGTELVVQSIFPVNEAMYRGLASNRQIVELNRALANLCREEGLRFIDLHADLVDEGGGLDADYTFDGVHLNGRGYRIWRDRIHPFVVTAER